MRVQGGYSTYGQPIGILMFRGVTPRIPGDIGHAATLGVPVCYEILEDVGFGDLVEGSEETLGRLLAGARRLEAKGVKAITGDCGLLVRYQKEIAAAVRVPFFSSSLLLIPLVWQLQGCSGEVGMITGHRGLLRPEHLAKASVTTDIPLAIAGLEEVEEFKRVVMGGQMDLHVDRMREGLMDVVDNLLQRHPAVRSLVLECSNLPSYGDTLYERFGRPVYDIVGLAKLMQHTVMPPHYPIFSL